MFRPVGSVQTLVKPDRRARRGGRGGSEGAPRRRWSALRSECPRGSGSAGAPRPEPLGEKDGGCPAIGVGCECEEGKRSIWMPKVGSGGECFAEPVQLVFRRTVDRPQHGSALGRGRGPLGQSPSVGGRAGGHGPPPGAGAAAGARAPRRRRGFPLPLGPGATESCRQGLS